MQGRQLMLTAAPRRLLVLILLVVSAGIAAVAAASMAQGAAFAAKASVEPGVQYLHDHAGTVFTFTVHNTGRSRSIGAVEISRPSSLWTIGSCPTAPAGWTTERTASSCRYLSAHRPGDDLDPGASSSRFGLKARTGDAGGDRAGTWHVVVSKSNSFDDSHDLGTAGAEGRGLNTTAHAWQITRAVVAASAQSAGASCPAAQKSATAGSTGNVIILCGRNRTDAALTPSASHTSLGGTFVQSHGAFLTDAIPAHSPRVVLGSWSDATVTSTPGAGKTVVATVGSSAHQTSPPTTKTDYKAVNSAPVAINDDYTTSEDSPLTVGAPGVLLNDTDAQGQPLTAVLGADAAHGHVVLAPDGSFVYTPGGNFNGSDNFTYTASDGLASSAPATVHLTVTPVNDLPTATSVSTSTPEDAAVSVPLAGSDPDGNSLTRSIVANPTHGGLGAITSGAVTYTPDPDYHGPDSFTFKVNDGSADSNVATVSLTVSSVNDAPTFTLPASPDRTVAEDASAQTVNGFATALSPGPADESAQTLTFDVTNNNNNLFSAQPSIDPATGNLTFTPAANANGAALISAVLNDNGGTANGGDDSTTKTFTITVSAVNDAPVGHVPIAQTINEDELLIFSTGNSNAISASDVDAGSGTVNVTLDATGTLTLGQTTGLSFTAASPGSHVAFSGALTDINAALNGLSYNAGTNTNGSDTLQLAINDNGNTGSGGAHSSAPTSVAITVTAVNDEPSFALPGSPGQTVLEDAGAQTVSGFATAMSAGPSDESAQTLTFDVTNNSNSLFSAQPDIDETTGDLTFTPAANRNGSATVSVKISDNGGTANSGDDTSGTQTFTITVTAVNDEPSFTLPGSPDQSVVKNSSAQTVSGFASAMSAGPSDESAQTLTFDVTNNSNSLFSSQPDIDQTSGDLTYTPAADTTGTATVTVKIADDGGTANGGDDTSPAQTFTIDVHPPNAAPTDIALTPADLDENQPAATLVGTLTSTDADAADTHTYDLVAGTGDDDNAKFSITGDQLYSSATFNYETQPTASIRVRTTDSGPGNLTFARAITITINDLNEAPTDISMSKQDIGENSGANAVIGSFSTTDPDTADPHVYTLVTGTGDTDNGAFNISGSDLRQNASFNYEAKSSYTVRVRSTDAASTFTEKQFTITVNNLNEAPTDISLSKQNIDENSGADAVVGSLSATDQDAGQTYSYSLITGTGDTDNGAFNISGGNLRENASFNFENKSSYSIRLQTTDNGSPNLSFEKQFTITVDNVNEAPTNISLSKSDIDENGAVNAVIGALTSTDEDTGQTYTYSLVSGSGSTDNASFNISGSNLRESTAFNYEVKNSYSIRIRTTDNGSPNLSFEKQFTITINDINDAPVANADSYTGAIGNTLAAVQTTPSGPKVVLTGSVTKANDTDEDATFPHTLSVTGETVASTGGGTATIGTDGSFTFLPGVGDKNQDDNFTYHVTDGALTTAGTVTVHIDNFLVWYVDSSSAASTHDGRSSQPFTGLSSLNGAGGSGDSDGTGDYVFLYRGNSGTTPYAGGIPLEASQSLWGEKQGLTVNGIALVAAGANPAVITSAAGTGVGLANGVDVEGLNISGTSGDGINGSAVTTATVGTSSAVNVSTAGGDGVDLSGAATGNISIAAPITGSTGHSVTLSGRTGGTVALSGAISDTGTGINLSSNTGATINFTGGITASTGSNSAFSATGGGTVNVTGTTNTLATTTGTALTVANTNVGSSGLTFQSISANGAVNGIVLNNTGPNNALTVASSGSGTCTAADQSGCTGGTIQNTTGADDASTTPVGTGVMLKSTKGVSLTRMHIANNSNYAIRGDNVTGGFTLANSVVNGANGSETPQGGGSPYNESALRFTELTGSNSITNSAISGGASDNLGVINSAGILNRLTVQGDTFGNNSATQGNRSLDFSGTGTATMNVTVDSSTFTASASHDFGYDITGVAGDVIFTNNTMSQSRPVSGPGAPATGAGNVKVTSGASANLTMNVSGNTMTGATGNAMLFVHDVGSGSFTGTVNNNIIGNAAIANSGSLEGDGIQFNETGGTAGSSSSIAITNNQVRQYNNFGIELASGSSGLATETGNIAATVTGNTIANPGTNANISSIFQGIQLNTATVDGQSFSWCANIKSNSIIGSGRNAGTDFRLRQRFDTVVRLPGYAGTAFDTTAVTTFVQNQNDANPNSSGAEAPTPTGASLTDQPSGGQGFVGGAACASG
jgi:hypothetical protein